MRARLCCRYRVQHSYLPQHSDELQLTIGDIIKVTEKCDDGWWVGAANSTNKFGLFPGNYVKPL
ncbi:hypothetical protein HELRODRAFT_90371 [Helobdella robusta]|uniref:SH3 domain-containing protein n=1 Tax=Helobdella robusta TaxID=6412 RepID=T1G7Q1_HELRO|nr:hypothetical protein HELRODRAFT_90371 [Helobdella robusta]ESN91166.1 hypothetical protein HELRODRAFT_90371 [Helobdella robusta]